MIFRHIYKINLILALTAFIAFESAVAYTWPSDRWSFYVAGGGGTTTRNADPDFYYFYRTQAYIESLNKAAVSPADIAYDRKAEQYSIWRMVRESQGPEFLMTAAIAEIGMEYRKTSDMRAVVFSLRNRNAKIICKSGCVPSMGELTLIDPGDQPAGYAGAYGSKVGTTFMSPLSFQTILEYERNRSKLYKGSQDSNETFFNIGYNIHLLPDSVVDPYVGIGVGFGQDSNRSYAMMGLRINFGSTSYLMVQAEYNGERFHSNVMNLSTLRFQLQSEFPLAFFLNSHETKSISYGSAIFGIGFSIDTR